MTVLVAGEGHELRDLLLPFLAEKRYAPLFVSDGEELIELARMQPLDVIIIDLDMLVRDGLTTLEELKSDPATASIPVIMVAQSTGMMAHLKELDKFLRENTIAILDKPVDITELDRAIAGVLGEAADSGGCLTGEMLARLLDGELSGEEAERAQRHLARCQTCQEQYDEWQSTDSFLKVFFRTGMMVRIEPSEECLSRRKVTAYFRNGLSAQDRAEVEAHLSRCSYCTRELVALHRLMKEFDQKEPAPLSEERPVHNAVQCSKARRERANRLPRTEPRITTTGDSRSQLRTANGWKERQNDTSSSICSQGELKWWRRCWERHSLHR